MLDLKNGLRLLRRVFVLVVGVTLTTPSAAARAAEAGPRQVDVARVTAAGVRVLEGKYVRVLTDLPASPAVDELPKVFDAAIPQWCDYFHVDPKALNGKRWLACVVKDRDLFAALGLLSKDNPTFINGYANGWELWLMDQSSDYYRRHLLLHEGTHAFMQTQLGGCGPGWYMEGTAELFGTHEWQDGRLKLAVFPANRNDFPMWGRIKIIREAVRDHKAWSLEQVLALDNSREMSVDNYAWAWALAAMIHNNPKTRDGYRNISEGIRRKADLTEFVKATTNLVQLTRRWQTFISQLDYGGYDFARMEIVVLDESPNVIDAARGWKAAKPALRKGITYRITASGRYQIVGGDEPWECEPGGITLEYYDGKPLGVLLGAFANRGINDEGSFARPITVGLETTITPDRDGWLFLRVNEAPMKLADNRGEVTVKIEEIPPKETPGR